jgi:hypothetical protein
MPDSGTAASAMVVAWSTAAAKAAAAMAGRHRVGPGRTDLRHGWWLVLYFGCGAIGQMFGYLWEPPDSRASVAGAGLLGAVCAWLLSPAGPRQVQVRVWGWSGRWSGSP